MPDEQTRGLSAYGIAAIVFGVIGIAAVVLGSMIWSGHRGEVAERGHQAEVLRAAAEWTGLLINVNKDSATENLRQLRDGTVGQLNVEFDNTMAPFTGLVAKLQSKTVGQVESVSIETLHHEPGDAPGQQAGKDSQPELARVASRTDTVLVVATSVNQNVGAEPTTVRWKLRLDVADVDGKLLISHLETIR
jgi:hypothetical protein